MDSSGAAALPISGNGPIKSAGEVGVPKNGSHISSATASSKDTSDGRREELQTLAGFDALRFKNNFLEMVEELRLLRTLKYENDNHIEQLLTEKHELTHKLDEAISHSETLKESNSSKLQALTQKHEEQLREHKAEQAKRSASQQSREKELKALKDEMRALHLTKHVLEKKVQEQDRQIKLHFSSRDDYLSKMTQLEEKCSSLFKIAEDTNEHVEMLEANVKKAKELHCQLEYVNTHQNCELQEVRLKLESCHKELIESRASRRMELDAVQTADAQDCTAKLKTAQQELKMQEALCQHLQAQLSLLRAEHDKSLNQIKEGHTLLERHVETANRAMQDEEKLRKNLDDLQADVQLLEDKASMAERDCQVMREKYAMEKADLDKKLLDMEQRLCTLQSDYKLLQDSYDRLEASRDDMKRKFEVEREELEAKCVQLEATNASRELSEKIRNLQNALDQSELQLATCEEKLQEKSSMMKTYEGGKREVFVRASPAVADNPEFSPEVIPREEGDISRSTAAANTSSPGNKGVQETCEMPCVSLKDVIKEQGFCSTHSREYETNCTEGSGSPKTPPAKIDQVEEDKLSSITREKLTQVDCTEESGPHKDLPAKECETEEHRLNTLRKERCNKEAGRMCSPPEDPTPCEMDIAEEDKIFTSQHSDCPKDCHTSGSGHPNEGREMPRNMSGNPMPPLAGISNFSQTGWNNDEDNTVQFPLPKKIKLDAVVINRSSSSPETGSQHGEAGPRHSLELRISSLGGDGKMRLPQCCTDIEVEGLGSKAEGEGKGLQQIKQGRDGEACPKFVPEANLLHKGKGGAGEECLNLSPKAGEECLNLSPKAGEECLNLSLKGEGGAGEESRMVCANLGKEEVREEYTDISPKGKERVEEVCPSLSPDPELKQGGAGEVCPNSTEEKGAEILFSPDFGHSMLSTQMNRQINKVESFLKMDRLRRQKPMAHH